MTETRVPPASAPDIDRENVRTVFMSHWHVTGADQGRAVLDEITDAWEGASRPPDVLSFSCYLSTGSDHFTVMTYARLLSSTSRAFRSQRRSTPRHNSSGATTTRCSG